MSEKEKAFALFDEGKTTISPEVKELKLKSKTRYNYYLEWRKAGNTSSPSLETPSEAKGKIKEAIGGIDETKQVKRKASPQAAEEAKEPEVSSQEKHEEAKPEKPKVKEEAIGIVSEVVEPKDKDGKPPEPERKIATTVVEDGIQCRVFLSLQTLALYRIAATTQAQYEDGELSLGDFLDTCAENFYKVRGKKLGLISTGGE